jgi:NADPH2:quinone reductase
MKAIRVDEFGGPEVLRVSDVAEPSPGPAQILVRIHASGVNPVDTYIRSGTYARLPELPYTPGNDGAGIVERVGPGVTAIKTGDRVYLSGSITGTLAQYCLATESQVHALPPNVAYEEGAALGVPYATAYRALFQRGRAMPGEIVLVHGGTGAVGTACVQFAKAAGLRIFATGGSETGRLLLLEQGAESVFDHHEMGYDEQILSATDGRGVDLIIEMLANVNLAKDLTLLARRGRVIVVGSRGPIEINPRDAMSREADIRGVMLFSAPADELANIHEAIRDGLRDGPLRPIVERRFALKSAPEAHEAVLRAGAHGKIVVIP